MPACSMADSAAIVNSGSTNMGGFRILVGASGSAEYTARPRRVGPPSHESAQPVRRKLPRSLVQRFYSDLDAAKPLSSLPEPRCMKSASFGSSLRVELGDQQTPDLSCGDAGSAALRKLIRDVNEIVSLFNAK